MPDRPEPSVQASAGVSIALVFTLVVVGLVVLTAVTILAVVDRSARTSIRELLKEKAEIVTYTIVERVRNSLEPVAIHAAFTASIIGEIDAEGLTDGEIGRLLFTSLAALPQVSSIALVDSDVRLVRCFRNRKPPRCSDADWSDDPRFVGMIEAAGSVDGPFWGPLFYSERSGATYLNLIAPARSRDGASYLIVSSVSLADISDFISLLRNEMTGQSFILYGKDAVLAYSAVPAPGAPASDQHPLPLLSEIAGTPLSRIWSDDRLRDFETGLENDIEARVVEIEEGTVVFLFRRLDGFGEEPWYIGTHFALDDLAPQLARSRTTIAVSAAIIALSGLIALALSRLVSRPVRDLAAAAERITSWKIDQLGELPRSFFREINEASIALNYALGAFASLQEYLPPTLARRLIEQGDPATIESEEHTITILFIDIVDFTGLAEERSPKDVVSFLNEHFTLVTECIETEHGVVDKFIGDAVMAFWGGLESDREHAAHACRAALRIEEAMYHQNGVRRASGRRPVRLRVGIHSGKAMLGNIGSAGRLNYTVIGDSVNTAQRLERLAREIGGEEPEVVTLISGDTAMRLGPEFLIAPLGRKVLHGRHEETDVFVLKSGAKRTDT